LKALFVAIGSSLPPILLFEGSATPLISSIKVMAIFVPSCTSKYPSIIVSLLSINNKT
jgi:hypothetical protein